MLNAFIFINPNELTPLTPFSPSQLLIIDFDFSSFQVRSSEPLFRL